MNSHSFTNHPAWTAAGWTMIHLVWVGAAVGLAAALLRRRLRDARPETRHGAAVFCLMTLTAAPLTLFASLYRPEPAPERASAQAPRAVPAVATTTSPVVPPDLGFGRPVSGRDVAPPTVPSPSRFEPVVGYLPGVWLAGSLATLALLATGLAGVEGLRRSSVALEAGPVAGRCRALAASLGVARGVGVAVCDRAVAPVLIGVVRPMILLPPAALCGWTVEQVEMALLHELAHVRRHDNLVALAQRFAEALLFFHPVAWRLSAWVDLERELCCDRLVVERTGRPHAYARMLASLAGAGPGPTAAALAMAERPLTTRIRRILDMEDRSMKMTLTEGLGLLSAAIAGTALTLAAHAAPPPETKQAPDVVTRRALERMAGDVAALRDGHDGNVQAETLIQIARAQLKIGDRAAARATLDRLGDLAEPPTSKDGRRPWPWFAALATSAELRHEAGDVDGDRAALARAARYLEGYDDASLRTMFNRVAEAADRKDDAPRSLSDEEAAFLCEGSFKLIDLYVALGDQPKARTLARRALAAVGPINGPTKILIQNNLGASLVKAGDAEGGRRLIEQSHRAALALSDPDVRSFSLAYIVHSLAKAGDVDGALALVRETPARSRQAALAHVVQGLAVDSGRPAVWFDPAGVNVKIGDPWQDPKEPAAARAALPKVAAAARASGDAKVEARTLAAVALLQARAGDVPGALATARSIPALRRSDDPGPADGFYDAVKPATLALVAGVRSDTGDAPGAAATLAEAESLARAVEAADQKLVAQIVVAQAYADCGLHDTARGVVAEATPLALAQPEPRRSRVLTMFAAVQAQAGDEAGALKTVDAIRDYPGLEKVRALSILADRRERAGDSAGSAALLRRATAVLEAKAPETPLPGEVLRVKAFSRDTFVDFDLELEPAFIAFERESRLQDVRTRTGDLAAAVRVAEALPPARREAALSGIAGNLARHGDVAAALDFASSIESPDTRLRAFTLLASAIPGRQAVK